MNGHNLQYQRKAACKTVSFDVPTRDNISLYFSDISVMAPSIIHSQTSIIQSDRDSRIFFKLTIVGLFAIYSYIFNAL